MDDRTALPGSAATPDPSAVPVGEIVGAHALAFHGAPRFTGDLDILVRPTEDNGRLVLLAIADFGFPTAPLGYRCCAAACADRSVPVSISKFPS